mgnify:CR=1 FL=1
MLRSADNLEFLLRIIYKRTKLPDFLLTHGSAEKFGNLAFDVTGSVSQNVSESLVFAVDVGDEMFSAFR